MTLLQIIFQNMISIRPKGIAYRKYLSQMRVIERTHDDEIYRPDFIIRSQYQRGALKNVQQDPTDRMRQ